MRPHGSLLSWFRSLIANLSRGHRRDAELRADVASCLEILVAEKIAAGHTPQEAHRLARREFGDVNTATEETRSIRVGFLLAEFWQDVRYALRMLRRDVTFSVTAILTLALGIGANTAIFTVVNAVLVRPLPYADPSRLVVVWERNPPIGKDRDLVAAPNYLDWRTQNVVFDDIGAYRVRSFALSNTGEPEQLSALASTHSIFRVLGVDAAFGRAFTEDEERRREHVVVLAHDFWQRRFGADRAIVGRSIVLDGVAFTVVGVMPPQFKFPDGAPVDLYSPIVFSQQELAGRRAHLLMVIARLKERLSLDRATSDLGTIAQRIAAADATSNPDVTLVRFHDVLVEDVRLGLITMFAAVGLVLLIACANVANLLLVRAASRRREIAMRAALGAERRRLFRQLLTESLVLSTLGAAVGTTLAWGLIRTLVRYQPPNLQRLEGLTIDSTVLLFVVAIAFLTGIGFGVIPALHAATPRLSEATKPVTDSAPARGRTRSALLVAEIAISLMLLVGAALIVRSLLKVQSLDLGFRPDGVLTAQILLARTQYPTDPLQFGPLKAGTGGVAESKASQFFAELEKRLQDVPGIESVGAVSALPLNPIGVDYDLPVVVEGKPQPRRGEEPQADFRTATTGYFRTMGIPLLRGREFTEFDGPNSTPVAIVNETLARAMFPGEDALGKRLLLYGRPREIVGVVGAVRHHGFSREARPEMILPYRQFQFGAMTLVVRSAMDRSAVAVALTSAVYAMNPQQPVYRVRMMNEFLADSVAQPRLTAWLVGSFAALALLLAVVGIYGVTSYIVNQRLREIAVRLAIGAERGEVAKMIAGQCLGYAALGVVIGIVAAVAGTRLISGLLFGVTATDPLTFIGAAGALVITAIAASSLPVLRAANVAPASLLRSE